eukprot:5563288-Ditylum_brightwellii.AAC.1
MAGAVFPPQLLQHVASLHSALCTKQQQQQEEEEGERNTKDAQKDPNIIEVEDELGLLSKTIPNKNDDDNENEEDYYNSNILHKMKSEELIRKFVQQTLPSSNVTYDIANVWQRSRVRYPKVSLDEIRVELPVDDVDVSFYSSEKDKVETWKEQLLSFFIQNESETDSKKEEEEKSIIHHIPLRFVL